jgi:prevent-host-death family protein
VKSVPSAKFKNQCLAVLDEVERTRRPIVVTRHGKPVAQIRPILNSGSRTKNPIKGSIEFEGDLIAPIEGAWDALS